MPEIRVTGKILNCYPLSELCLSFVVAGVGETCKKKKDTIKAIIRHMHKGVKVMFQR